MVRAVTLAELLLAVCLISLVVLSGGALYTAATGFFTTFSTQIEKQNDANFILQHMVRHIFLAEDVEILSSSSLRLTRLDGTSYEYWQDGSNVKYNGGGSDEIIITGVNELRFSDRTVDETSQRISLAIGLTMEGNENLKVQPLRFVTKVTSRRYE